LVRRIIPAVSQWSARSLVRVGPALMLGAVALALFLLFFGEFVGGISPVLMVAIPVLGLLTFVGFIVTLIGAARWAFQAPMRRLIWFGVALTSLGVACFVVGEKMHYGFDDPNILFVPAITIPPPTCGASPTGICRHSPLPRAYEHTKIAGLVVTTGIGSLVPVRVNQVLGSFALLLRETFDLLACLTLWSGNRCNA